jgi:deoxyribose-phosphate aldolase
MFSENTNPAAIILPLIDLTSLSGNDNASTISSLCRLARECHDLHGFPYPAAICVYPPFAAQVKREMQGTPVDLACVAGAFPSGQLPLGLRLLEVRYCLDEGADEIDMVISRGALIEGNNQAVIDEVASFKQICGKKLLKVILETSDLNDSGLVRRASDLALSAGADFIKTSTGKGEAGASPEFSRVMLESLSEFRKESGETRGFKAAGGIGSIEQAMGFISLAASIMGEDYIKAGSFRIGASRLVRDLISSR